MCIRVKEIVTITEPMKVWKVCRHSRTSGETFISYFPPGWRVDQGVHYPGLTDQLKKLWSILHYFRTSGSTKRYRVGTTHTSKAPGMYCFESERAALDFAKERAVGRKKPILLCEIPAGTTILKGEYQGNWGSVITPKLTVKKLARDLEYQWHSSGRGWVDHVTNQQM